MADRPYNVLFLCTGNSARSIIAEAILNKVGTGHFRAYSAGSQPKGQVHPYTIDLLRKLNHDVAGFVPKSWHKFVQPDAPKLDFIFTVCDNTAEETRPAWPGQPMTAHWAVPDPAQETDAEGRQLAEAEMRAAFADTYRMLNNRIGIFVSLPLQKLDRLTVQKRLQEIGSTVDKSSSPSDA